MRRMRLIAVLLGVLAFFGACSSDDPGLEATDAPEATTEATDDGGAAGGDDIQIAAQVQLAEVGELGEVLVDENQHTIYLFKQDTSDESTCTGGCSTTWPAVKPAADGGAGEGVHEDMLDTNDDGQAVYNGHPLYTYSGDSEPGQANGQGIGDNWYAVDVDGNAVGD